MRLAPLLIVLALVAISQPADARPLPVDTAPIVVDLTWMTACPGPWGHEERDQVGPVTVRRYECDDPNA